jgi:chromosomal replication initiation ATPase DnaA
MSHRSEQNKRNSQRQLELRRKMFPTMNHCKMDYLTKIVCEVFCVDELETRERNNMREYSEARQTIMYLASKEALPQWYIGAYLNWRDHSTILHGIKTVNNTLMGDRIYAERFNKIKELLKTGATPNKEKEKTIQDLNVFH